MPRKSVTDEDWWREKVRDLEELGAKPAEIDPDVVYTKDGFWPLMKLVIMRYALGFYGPILAAEKRKGTWVGATHFVDLCAGSGVTRVMPKDSGDGGRPLTVAGSALIGAKDATFDFYHFVEPNRAAAAALSKRLALFQPTDKFRVYNMEAADAIPLISGGISGTGGRLSPHFLAFVDPEGFTEVTLPDLVSLLGRRGDVLFNFQYMGVKRAPEAASRFFGSDAWPRDGSDDDIRQFFFDRLSDLGRPATRRWSVKAGSGRYAYDVVYCAAKTSGNMRWLENLGDGLSRRIGGMTGRSLEDVLFQRGLRRFGLD